MQSIFICNSLLQSVGMTLDRSFLVFDPHFIPYVDLTLIKIIDNFFVDVWRLGL